MRKQFAQTGWPQGKYICIRCGADIRESFMEEDPRTLEVRCNVEDLECHLVLNSPHLCNYCWHMTTKDD
jgi:hypothetical protein